MTCQAQSMDVDIAFPGEVCNLLTRCFAGNCDSKTKRCTGLSQGATCGSDKQCAPGLYCKSSVCSPQLPVGATGCASSYECLNSASCNRTKTSSNCVQYFSVPVGGVVSDCDSNISYMCASGSCSKSPKAKLGTCVSAIRSVAKQPATCSSNLDCVGVTSNNQTFTSSCSCGLNPEGNSYCSLFPGDAPGQNLMSLYSKFLNSTYIGTCNTGRRYSTECILSSSFPEKEQLAMANLYFEFYPQLQNNDICIKQVFNNQYWNLSSAAALIVSLAYLLA
eukprot:CAMPEP_0204906842 /NCGR_PEP_ID=MMETSP1397-20131031/6183_1 /ASSEMBLY_ACC=CAM_ASM_000891 /TAXON_ID=49980 /ORGANISM="Climacostomum Climacostomum virens, Strain Stock W-24" /LENGTH=276 /DNA_ID=CAMNT_0052075847 /DNA_START=236 /DNA_END=1066 /DNA_ORIENTATION=-